MKQRICVFNGIEKKSTLLLFFIFIIIIFAAFRLLYESIDNSSPLIDYYLKFLDFKYVIIIILLLMLGFYKLTKYTFKIVGKPKSWTIELNEEICITNDKESFSISPDDLIKIKVLATEDKGLLFLKTAKKRFSLSIPIYITLAKDNILNKSNLMIFTQFINDLEEYFLEKGFNLKKSSPLIGFYFSKK